MSIQDYAIEIDEQIKRLTLVFPESHASIMVDIEKHRDNRTTCSFQSYSDHNCSQWLNTPKESVDGMLKASGISKVTEYMMANHHRFGEVL